MCHTVADAPATYAQRGRSDLKMSHVEQNTVYADPADRGRFLEGLRKAGLQS